MLLFTIFLYLQMVSSLAEASNSAKRILLDDPDIVQQLVQLKQEFNILKTSLNAAQSDITNLKANLSAVSV